MRFLLNADVDLRQLQVPDRLGTVTDCLKIMLVLGGSKHHHAKSDAYIVPKYSLSTSAVISSMLLVMDRFESELEQKFKSLSKNESRRRHRVL